MTLYMSLLLAAAVFPVLLYGDYKHKRRSEIDPEISYDYNNRPTRTLLSFSPFIILFYTEQFWINLLWLAPLYTYYGVLMLISHKKSWCIFTREDIPISGGSGIFVTILAYYIWFHQGAMGTDASGQAIRIYTSVWPYYTFGAITIITLLKLFYDKANSNGGLVLLCSLAFPLLPLFIASYWWGLLAGFITYMIIISVMFKYISGQGGGNAGAATVMGYIYLMAMMLSIILFAILR